MKFARENQALRYKNMRKEILQKTTVYTDDRISIKDETHGKMIK